MASIYFISLVAYGMHPVFTVVGTFIFQVQCLGAGRNFFTNGCLSSATDNFDKELMMDHDLDELPQFLRQVITLSLEFLKKSSTYSNSILQVIASCIHLTEFFLSPPSKEHQCFRLYYKFANVIHSMVTGGLDVVNPYNFVDIFMSYHKKNCCK
jgi:hypothetical protein